MSTLERYLADNSVTASYWGWGRRPHSRQYPQPDFSLLSPFRPKRSLHNRIIMSSTTPEPTTDAAQVSADAQPWANYSVWYVQLGDWPVTFPPTDLAKSLSNVIALEEYVPQLVLILPSAVQIDLDRPHYMNTKVYIRTDREESKSKWFGFRKYSQINWELDQPRYLTSSCRVGSSNTSIVPAMFPNVTTSRFCGGSDVLCERIIHAKQLCYPRKISRALPPKIQVSTIFYRLKDKKWIQIMCVVVGMGRSWYGDQAGVQVQRPDMWCYGVIYRTRWPTLYSAC